jgi:RND family efflux transporter MFP subunit
MCGGCSETVEMAGLAMNNKTFCGCWLGALLLFGGWAVAWAQDPEPLKAMGLVVPYRQSELASRTDGVVAEILVEEGNEVKEGQVLARMESKKEELNYDYYKALVAKSSNDLVAADELFKDNILSKTDREQKAIEARLAETQCQISQESMDEKLIKAPYAGIFMRRFHERGEAIKALERYGEIVNIDKVYVVIYFDAAQLPRVKRGQRAEVQIPTQGDTVFPGTVEIVDPVVDPSSALFRIKVVVENSDHKIGTGTKGQVVLMEDAHASATK